MSVYFITARQVGLVKIGCAFDPWDRMIKLNTASPVELVLEGLREGAYEQERDLHRRFADQRVRGEWFQLTPEIEALIAESERPPKPRTIAERRRILRMHRAEPPRNRGLDRQEKRYAEVMAEMARAREQAMTT